MKIEYVIQEKGAVANEELQQLPNWVKSLREEKRAEKGSQKLQKEDDENPQKNRLFILTAWKTYAVFGFTKTTR